MNLRTSSVTGYGRLVWVIALLPLVVLITVQDARSASGADYDIPTSELNKVKKETPQKRVTGESRKKKKSDLKSKKSSTDGSSADSAAKSAKSEPLLETVSIHHVPFSFVVAGKRTVIQAVVNSDIDIHSVTCKIRVDAGGAQSLVKMAKVNGTRFTYSATLPGLAPEVTSLRYILVVLDVQGKETASQEFLTPVSTSTVVPGWQIETTGESIQLELKDAGKPAL